MPVGTCAITVTNLDPRGNIPEWVVRASTNKKTPASMRLLRGLVAPLAPITEYTPPTMARLREGGAYGIAKEHIYYCSNELAKTGATFKGSCF